jgi:hypothetical protein
MYFKIVFSVHNGVIEFFFCGCRHVFAPFVIVAGLAGRLFGVGPDFCVRVEFGDLP